MQHGYKFLFPWPGEINQVMFAKVIDPFPLLLDCREWFTFIGVNLNHYLIMQEKKYPNAAVISILTVDDPDAQVEAKKVLFFNVRPVASRFPDTGLYWYPGAGKAGTAKLLRPQKKLRHYFAIGRREEVAKTLQAMLDEQPIAMGSAQQVFRVPAHTCDHQEPDNMWGIAARQSTAYVLSRPLDHIPPSFLDAAQLNALSGWLPAIADTIAIQPPGFYGKNELYQLFQKNIFGVVEHETPKVHSYGNQKTAIMGEGSLDFYGFYQNYAESLHSETVELQNSDGTPLAQAPVNEHGLFNFHVDAPVADGILVTKPRKGASQRIHFSLIQNLDIRSHIVDTIYTDPYKRAWNLTDESRKRPEHLPASTWQKDKHLLPVLAEQMLCDRFSEVLAYLGPHVLIADPYFLGPVTPDHIFRNKDLAHCQKAFLYAIYHCKIVHGLQQLDIMGNKDKLKDIPVTLSDGEEGVGTGYIENYKLLFHRFFHKPFADLKIGFYHANRFHNRYWFGLNQDPDGPVIEKCVIITNSLGNMQEVDIMPVMDPSQLKDIATRYMMLYNFSLLL